MMLDVFRHFRRSLFLFHSFSPLATSLLSSKSVHLTKYNRAVEAPESVESIKSSGSHRDVHDGGKMKDGKDKKTHFEVDKDSF